MVSMHFLDGRIWLQQSWHCHLHPLLCLMSFVQRSALIRLLSPCMRQQMSEGTATPAWSFVDALLLHVDALLLHEGRVFVPADSSLWQRACLRRLMAVGTKGFRKLFTVCALLFIILMLVVKCGNLLKDAPFVNVIRQSIYFPLAFYSLWMFLVLFGGIFRWISWKVSQKVGGRSVILSVVNRFSKYAHFITLSHPYPASTVARVFF